MKKSTKFLFVLSAGLILAGVPTGFALGYKANYNDANAKNTELSATLNDTKAELEEKLSK